MDRRACWTGAAALLLVGCVERLPPPEAPPQRLSAELTERAAAADPGEGEGVLVLDTTEGPAMVTDVGREVDGAGRTEVCTTPCVAELALGEHELIFREGDRSDTVTVQVEPTPRAHVRTLSYDSGAHREYVTVGVTGIALGGASLFLIDPLASMDDDLTATDGALIAAAALGGAALVAGIVGVVLAVADPQRLREGISSEWRLALE